jgi:hypothetical protein
MSRLKFPHHYHLSLWTCGQTHNRPFFDARIPFIAAKGGCWQSARTSGSSSDVERRNKKSTELLCKLSMVRIDYFNRGSLDIRVVSDAPPTVASSEVLRDCQPRCNYYYFVSTHDHLLTQMPGSDDAVAWLDKLALGLLYIAPTNSYTRTS